MFLHHARACDPQYGAVAGPEPCQRIGHGRGEIIGPFSPYFMRPTSGKIGSFACNFLMFFLFLHLRQGVGVRPGFKFAHRLAERLQQCCFWVGFSVRFCRLLGGWQVIVLRQIVHGFASDTVVTRDVICSLFVLIIGAKSQDGRNRTHDDLTKP